MKKIVSLVLAMVFVFGVLGACAEEGFVLRGGIRFGDDEKTIREKETWQPIDGEHVFQYEGNLLDIPCEVTYLYDVNGQMQSVVYFFGKTDENGNLMLDSDKWMNMLAALVTKYGMPCYGEPAKRYQDRIAKDLTASLVSAEGMERTWFETYFNDDHRIWYGRSWLIPNGETSVLINLSISGNTEDNDSVLCTLCYWLYTEAGALSE